MAVIALITAQNMQGMFAHGCGTVVAANAVADNATMVEQSGRPGLAVVTIFTQVCTLYMTWVFACSSQAVVATKTASGYFAVIESR